MAICVIVNQSRFALDCKLASGQIVSLEPDTGDGRNRSEPISTDEITDILNSWANRGWLVFEAL